MCSTTRNINDNLRKSERFVNRLMRCRRTGYKVKLHDGVDSSLVTISKGVDSKTIRYWADRADGMDKAIDELNSIKF